MSRTKVILILRRLGATSKALSARMVTFTKSLTMDSKIWGPKFQNLFALVTSHLELQP